MTDILYYLFLAVLYILLLFKIDILGLKGDFVYIFFSEFAVNLAVYSNIFVIKFNKIKFLKNDKKFIFEIIYIYGFFMVFAGGFYYKNSLNLPLLLFIISLLSTCIRLNFSKDELVLKENFRIAGLQIASFFVAIIVSLFFHVFNYSATGNIVWGIVYSALTFLSLLFIFTKKSKKPDLHADSN